MDVRYVKASEHVKADNNKVAMQRGPIVYCFEWPDNKEASVRHLLLSDNNPAAPAYQSDLLNGVEVIHTSAITQVIVGNKVIDAKATVTAIPYYAWANRGAGDMSRMGG